MQQAIFVRVASKRKERGAVQAQAGETVIDVDRLHPILGNKHILVNHNDDQERGRVIAAYVRDLDADIAMDGPMSKEIKALATRALDGERLALQCWCARLHPPRDCHAYYIRRRIFEFADQDPDEFFLSW